MTHLPTAETVALLQDYFLGPERKAIADVRQPCQSRMIRASSGAASQLRHVRRDSVIAADFGDSGSQQVLDAIADALIAPLAIQQAREDHERWVTSRQVNQ